MEVNVLASHHPPSNSTSSVIILLLVIISVFKKGKRRKKKIIQLISSGRESVFSPRLLSPISGRMDLLMKRLPLCSSLPWLRLLSVHGYLLKTRSRFQLLVASSLEQALLMQLAAISPHFNSDASSAITTRELLKANRL